MLSSLDPVEDLRVPPFEPGLLPSEHHTLFVLPLFATFPPSVSLLKEPSCLLPVHIPLLELNTPLHTVFTPQKLLLLLLCTNPHPILSSPEERATFREAAEQPSPSTHVKCPEEEEGRSRRAGEEERQSEERNIVEKDKAWRRGGRREAHRGASELLC